MLFSKTRKTVLLSLYIFLIPEAFADTDPLTSWKDTAPKKAIVSYVEKVTTEGSADFIPVPERIAVFDNDGTLWTEYPIPLQAAFAFDEIKRRSATEPALADHPMVKALMAGDMQTLLAGKHHDGLMQILALTHAGISTEEFKTRVENWITRYQHPRFKKPLNELTYQPMQELLRYLRSKEFKTYIVSGGGVDFMRVFAEIVYGIPPEQVVGSSAQVKFEFRDGNPVLIKTLDHIFVDDREGKPAGIHQFIGRRPVACFGNSDGDQAMLEYTTINNPRPSFGLIVHHTDAQREYAYDAKSSSSGKLTTALADAPKRGWTVVDMKTDWSTIFLTDDNR